jgi:antitoxin ParD1/3/4
MNVSLTSELEQYVARKVESGLFQSASEVVRAGLRLLREQDELHQTRLEELRRELAIGIEQADQGRTKPFTAETVERIKDRGRVRFAAKAGADPA